MYIPKTSCHLIEDFKGLYKMALPLFRGKYRKRIKPFLKLVFRSCYNENNAFHNQKHAFEVLEVTSFILDHIGNDLSDHEKFLLKIVAVCHDLYHPGKTNRNVEQHLIKTGYYDIQNGSPLRNYRDRLSTYDGSEISPDRSPEPSCRYRANTFDGSESTLLFLKPILSNRCPYTFITTRLNVPCKSQFFEKLTSFVKDTIDNGNIDFNSEDEMTSITSNQAFNEEYHLKMAIELIDQHKFSLFSKHVITTQWSYFKNIIRSTILATNLGAHPKYLKYVSENVNTVSKLQRMILIIKLADLSHTWYRPFHIHLYWVLSLYREDEKAFTSCKQVAQDTLNFTKCFVTPMLDIIKLQYPKLYYIIIQQYNINQSEWKKILDEKKN